MASSIGFHDGFCCAVLVRTVRQKDNRKNKHARFMIFLLLLASGPPSSLVRYTAVGAFHPVNALMALAARQKPVKRTNGSRCQGTLNFRTCRRHVEALKRGSPERSRPRYRSARVSSST